MSVVGVLHLVDRLVAEVLAEPLVAPVVEHLGVDEVLVDRGQLGGEHLVEQLDDRRRVPCMARAAVRRRSNGDADVAAGVRARAARQQPFELRPAAAAAGAGAAAAGDLLDGARRPAAMAASTVRSVTPRHEQTYMARPPPSRADGSARSTMSGAPAATRRAATLSGTRTERG